MRIGIDCRLWNESGVGRYIRNLIENLLLLDRKNEYVLFVLSKDYESIKYKVLSIKYKKWSVVRVDIRWHAVEEQLKFPSIINKENLDLMHFTYPSIPIFYNKPFVVTIHDLIPHHFPTGEASTLPQFLYWLKLLGYKFVIKYAAKKAAKIITVSNATKKEIVDHLGVPEDKVAVTYEGIFENSKFKIQNSKLHLKFKNYFLYVGNAYPHKNLQILIQAFSAFCHPDSPAGEEGSIDSSSVSRRTQNDIQLILVGRQDYFYKRLKEKIKKLGLDKSIIFLGEVSDEELSNLYKNALALVMPSFMEGFGLPALEAMANECLVLGSNIPSLKEICGNAAIYFNPYNVNDMLQKMSSVIHSNDINHYSDKIKKGLQRAKMFSWKKMAEETLKVYQQTIDSYYSLGKMP